MYDHEKDCPLVIKENPSHRSSAVKLDSDWLDSLGVRLSFRIWWMGTWRGISSPPPPHPKVYCCINLIKFWSFLALMGKLGTWEACTNVKKRKINKNKNHTYQMLRFEHLLKKKQFIPKKRSYQNNIKNVPQIKRHPLPPKKNATTKYPEGKS